MHISCNSSNPAESNSNSMTLGSFLILYISPWWHKKCCKIFFFNIYMSYIMWDEFIMDMSPVPAIMNCFKNLNSLSSDCWAARSTIKKSTRLSPHLAQGIHRLVVEPCAHYVKGCHRQHHHHTADHAGTEGHQPAILWKQLAEKKTTMWWRNNLEKKDS